MKLWIRLFLAASIFLAPMSVYANYSLLEKPTVKVFINKMVDKYHFNKEKLIALFHKIHPQPRVVVQLKNPLEKLTWAVYQRKYVSEEFIKGGVDFRKKYHKTLVYAEKKYQVPGSIIIATLGAETKYGAVPGDFPVLDTLAHLGFSDEPRAPYFQDELEHFLLLTREHRFNPLKIHGSYAGAIGAPQFMPSSYRRFAVSYTKKSRADLIHNTKDCIVSIANYYHLHGWNMRQPVAIPAKVKGNKYLKLWNPDGTPIQFSSSKLGQYGIIPQRKVPKQSMLKLITLDGAKGTEYWLVFPNFDVIKQYNASNLYAMAVLDLGKKILSYKSALSRAHVIPERSKIRVIPELTKIRVIPERLYRGSPQLSRALRRSPLKACGDDMRLGCELSKTPLVPELSKTRIIPELSKISVIPELSKINVIPELSKISVIPERLYRGSPQVSRALRS